MSILQSTPFIKKDRKPKWTITFNSKIGYIFWRTICFWIFEWFWLLRNCQKSFGETSQRWLHVSFFISIIEMPRKSREQNTWMHLFFFGHTLIFNRLLGSNRSAAMKQTLVAAAAGQKNHKSFCMNPFLRCSKYVYFSLADAIELLGENGATGYVCYYTIHPPTIAQWNIFIFLIYLL